MTKIGENPVLVRNIDFEVARFQLLVKTRRKITSIFELHVVKLEGSLARNARLEAPTCLSS